MATRIYQEWTAHQWISADMSAESRKAVQEYLESDLFEDRGTFYDNGGNMLWFYGDGTAAIFEVHTPQAPTKAVLEVLYYPSKLFTESRSLSNLRFFHLLSSFKPVRKADRPEPSITYPPSALRKALINAVQDRDEDWFEPLLTLALRSGVDIPEHQLVLEVSAAVLRERRWKIMMEICEQIRLPDIYLESHLAPVMTQAISEGDTEALEFQQWLECEGWSEMQSKL